MAYRSGLFNSVNGDRKYQAAHFAEYFATFIGNGVFPNPSNGLQVYAKENMTVTVKPGKAWINGYYFVNDSDCDLALDISDGVLNRIDRIVLRFDTATRQIVPSVRKGTFSASPTAPAIQRDADGYEISLAQIKIVKGALAIGQGAILDERLDKTVCGIVHGTVDQVDTTTIFNQYQAWFNEVKNSTETEIETWKENQYQNFADWFATIQGILDGDVAANLANQILTLRNEVNTNNTNLLLEFEQLDNEKMLKKYKANKDSEGIFTTLTYKRADETTYCTSVLSGGITPQYALRTITFYEKDGVTIKKQKISKLSYDEDGDLVSEV